MTLLLLQSGPGRSGAASTPWLPSQLTTLKLWLKGDTLTGATGDAITTWPDASGVGNNATQSTGGNRPTLQTAHQNGLNVVRFNAANNNFFTLPNTFTSYTEGAIAFVGRDVNDPGTADLQDHGLFHFGNDSVINHYPYGGDNNIYDDFGSSVRKTVGNPAPSLAAYHVAGFRSKAAQWQYVLNGTVFFNTTTNTVAFRTNPSIGNTITASDYFNGYIGEIVFLNEFASTSDWQKIEGYLAWKWGLQSLLPAGHPYLSAPP